MRYLILYLVLMSVVSFALFGADKRFAKKHRWRIPERTLLLTAFIGGALGALIGMFVFRHKTQKPLFRILVPVALLLWIGILLLLRLL